MSTTTSQMATDASKIENSTMTQSTMSSNSSSAETIYQSTAETVRQSMNITTEMIQTNHTILTTENVPSNTDVTTSSHITRDTSTIGQTNPPISGDENNVGTALAIFFGICCAVLIGVLVAVILLYLKAVNGHVKVGDSMAHMHDKEEELSSVMSDDVEVLPRVDS